MLTQIKLSIYLPGSTKFINGWRTWTIVVQMQRNVRVQGSSLHSNWIKSVLLWLKQDFKN